MSHANWSKRVAALKAPWRDEDARRCLSLEFLWAAFFGTAIMQTYYEAQGLDQVKVNNLQALLAIATVAAGIPGGWLADRFGIRRAMIAGTLVQTANAIFFAQCRTYGEFQVSLLLTGISVALLSGTTSSLMTSALDTPTYKTYESWAVQMRCIGQIVAIIAGYFMVKHGDMHLPYQCQPIVYVACAVVTFRLKERSVRVENLSAKVMVRTAREMLWNQPAVRYATLFFASVGAGMILVFWLIQPRLRQSGVEIVDLGLLYLVKNLGTSVFGVAASLWANKLRIARTLLLAGLCAGVITSVAVPTIHGAVVLLLTHSFAVALFQQTQRVTFRDLLPDVGKRTTELAVASVFASLYFATLSWGFGEIGLPKSVNLMLACIVLATLPVAGAALWALHRSSTR